MDNFLPGDRCAINGDDFRDPRELAEYLRLLDTLKHEYQQYMAWHDRPLRPSLLAMCDSVREHSPARLSLTLPLGGGRP